MTEVRRIVVATRNRHKLQEIGEILADLPVELVPVEEFPLPDVEETGDTFEENAALKATEVARGTGLWAIADDSGLAVDALDGAPGVRSARYSEEGTASAYGTIGKGSCTVEQVRMTNDEIFF